MDIGPNYINPRLHEELLVSLLSVLDWNVDLSRIDSRITTKRVLGMAYRQASSTLLKRFNEPSVRFIHLSAASSKQVPLSNLEKDKYLPYDKLSANIDVVKKRLGRPLTLSEKVLYSHLDQPASEEIVRGESYLK